MKRITLGNKFSLPLIILVGTTLLLLALQVAALYPGITTPIERSEYAVRDVLMRIRGTRPTSGDIVIVAIDDFSFNWTGYQWPWPRTYLAQIIDEINKGGAKVVGVDIFLFEPDSDPEGDTALATALGNAPSAVSVMQIFQDSNQNVSTLRRPLSIYRDALDGMGITAFSLDEDAIIRSVRAYDRYGGEVFPHWAFELGRLYLDLPSVSITSAGVTFNGERVPLRGGNMLVNFAGPAATYPTYSAASVALGDVLAQNPDAFRDKIVLLGATTVTLQDLYPTPFSAQQPTPGVEVVANAVDTLISGKFLRETPPWFGLLLTLAAAVAAYSITRNERPNQIILLLIGAMLLYALVCYIAFAQAGWLVPVSGPEAMLFLGVVLPTLEHGISQELEKRRVRSLFNRFISPEMVDQLIATQDINSLNKRADLTILFSDIRGFTTMAEKLPPEEVVALLNSYLESMTTIVHKHGGTVDKYEGDALVAFFGEPVPYSDHAARATRAAVEMQTELPGLTEKWIAEGRTIRGFDVGIGLNSGEVFVGLIGSAQRINYTVIGDNANLASRLQDLTKTYQWPILVSESTYRQIQDEFEGELIDSVVVKGRSEQVKVYKILGAKGVPAARIQPWKT
ncbi:MAG TPA: adenylate/guanylate cyclase domain-containing protein [Burkholderiales bacterium]|nr:adenylate/guanylate cyclase domain-containing protein [Burkholderiales bacterium]